MSLSCKINKVIKFIRNELINYDCDLLVFMEATMVVGQVKVNMNQPEWLKGFHIMAVDCRVKNRVAW
jgi:hypothetical protein